MEVRERPSARLLDACALAAFISRVIYLASLLRSPAPSAGGSIAEPSESDTAVSNAARDSEIIRGRDDPVAAGGDFHDFEKQVHLR
jgi:hypothetical protein